MVVPVGQVNSGLTVQPRPEIGHQRASLIWACGTGNVNASIADVTAPTKKRFAKLISNFVDGCGFERPFHLVVIDALGWPASHATAVRNIERICAGPSKATRFRMTPPSTVACISGDGQGRSVTIEIEKAPATVQ